MASVLKDPAVVDHVEKQVEKAKAATRKQVLGELKKAFGGHTAALGDDKASVKAVAAFHKTAQASLKTAPAAE